MARPQPKGFNILITGTPGTGKSALSQLVAEELGLNHVCIGEVVKNEKFYCEKNEEFDTHMIEEDSEDKLLDYLEPIAVQGGNVFDHHSSALFPERWFHAVLVLRANTEPLFDRLTRRGYSDLKRSENLEVEIMNVCEDEARESYKESIVHVRSSNTTDEMMANVEFIASLMDGVVT